MKNNMKIEDIEPILQQLAAYYRFTPGLDLDRIDYGQDEITEALESMHRIVCKTIANRRNKAMKHDPLLENAGKRWSTEDDECLKEMFINSFKPSAADEFYIEAGKRFKRTSSAIETRLGHWQFISYPYNQEDTELLLRKLRRQHKF